MRVTTVMLADAATVREGLLHVLGGGINRLVRDPLPAPLGATLAMLLQPDDAADLARTHDLEITIQHTRSEGKSPVARALMTLSKAASAPGTLPPVALVVPIQSVPIVEIGDHKITVSVDGSEVATIEFDVLKAPDPRPR